MDKLYALLYNIFMGGFLRGYRTQLLGWVMLVGSVIWAFVQWSVGDVPTATLFDLLKEKWPLIVAGYGTIFVGDKIDDLKK